MRSIRTKVAATGGIVAVLGASLSLVVSSAFTSTTESNGNAFETGYMKLVRSGDEASALFDVELLEDDQVEQRCITITNDGTLDGEQIKLSRVAGAPSVAGKTLGDDVAVTVEALAGDAVDTADASCAAFNAAATGAEDTAVALADGKVDTAAVQDADARLLEAGAKVSYRFTARAELTNDDQGDDIEGLGYAWSIQQGS